MLAEERPREDRVRGWPRQVEEPSPGASPDGTLILDLEKNVCCGGRQACGVLGQRAHTHTDPLSFLISSFPSPGSLLDRVFSCLEFCFECSSVLLKKGNPKMSAVLPGGLLYSSSKIADCVSRLDRPRDAGLHHPIFDLLF